MSSFSSYKTAAFKETQKFFVFDPATGSPSFVQGSDLVSYLRPSLNSVDVETTTDAAVNADYDVGKVIQTTGESSPGDGNPGLFLVVAAGTGGIPMLNGNELLVLEGANTALGISYDNTASGYSATNVQEAIDNFAVNTAGEGSDLIAHTGTSDTVTEALDKRVIRKTSVAEIEALTGVSDYQVSLSGLRSGIFEFDSSDLSTEVAADTQQGIYIAPASDATGGSGAWVRQYNGPVDVRWFGAIGDRITDDTASIQAAVDYAEVNQKNVYFPRTSTDLGLYRITTRISAGDISILGDGIDYSGILCDGVDGFIFPAGTKRARVQNISLIQIVSHTTTPNTFRGVIFNGNDPEYCQYNHLENVFIDGFETGISCPFTWSTTFYRVRVSRSKVGIRSIGKSVNNFVLNCYLSGSEEVGSYGIDIGDATVATEGWVIRDTLTFDYETAVRGYYANNCTVSGCILDFCTKYGVLLQGTASGPSTNWQITDNYIALQGTALAGIYSLGATGNPQTRGSSISGNQILRYSGATLQNGIFIDGVASENTIVSNNRIEADIFSLRIGSGSTGCSVTNNNCLSGDISLSEETVYENNVGTMTTSVVLVKQMKGKVAHYYNSSAPVSGTYNRGDIVWNSAPAPGGFVGWVCTTSGTAGTDAVFKTFGAISA